MNEQELQIFKKIYQIPDVIKDAFEKYEPYLISRKLMDIVKDFNRYYYNNQIISDDIELTKHRIGIAYLIKTVIKSQLSLLGIETVEKM